MKSYNEEHVKVMTRLFGEIGELKAFRNRILAEENDHGSLTEALKQ